MTETTLSNRSIELARKPILLRRIRRQAAKSAGRGLAPAATCPNCTGDDYRCRGNKADIAFSALRCDELLVEIGRRNVVSIERIDSHLPDGMAPGLAKADS